MKKLIFVFIILIIAVGSFWLVKFKKSTKVAEAVKPIVLQDICTGQGETNFDCFETHYRKLVEQGGSELAFQDLRARYDKNEYIKSQCHPLTHVIGQEASKYYKTVSLAFTSGDSFCWSGYYHGVMEGFVGRVGRKNLPTQMDSICADVPDKKSYSFDYYNCVHGLGHGVMEISQDELFESLKMCDYLSGQWERQSCWSGVYMENVIVDGKNHFSKFLRPAEPLYPCNAVEDQYKNTCYMMQSSYMLKVTKYDFAKVFALCRQAGDAYTATCFQSIGRDASGSTVSNPEKTKAICLLGKDFTEQSNCLIGAVKDFISYYHSDSQARGLCLLMPETFSASCSSTVISYYASFK